MIEKNIERKKALQMLKTAKGQIEGIIKMIDDGRYCVDVSNQIENHLHHCVKEAFENDNGDEKIEEIIKILEKVMSK